MTRPVTRLPICADRPTLRRDLRAWLGGEAVEDDVAALSDYHELRRVEVMRTSPDERDEIQIRSRRFWSRLRGTQDQRGLRLARMLDAGLEQRVGTSIAGDWTPTERAFHSTLGRARGLYERLHGEDRWPMSAFTVCRCCSTVFKRTARGRELCDACQQNPLMVRVPDHIYDVLPRRVNGEVRRLWIGRCVACALEFEVDQAARGRPPEHCANCRTPGARQRRRRGLPLAIHSYSFDARALRRFRGSRWVAARAGRR